MIKRYTLLLGCECCYENMVPIFKKFTESILTGRISQRGERLDRYGSVTSAVSGMLETSPS